MRRSYPHLALVYASLSLGGCVSQFPELMTAEQLARYDSGPALVAYLGQGGPDTAVCDLSAQTPHLSKLSASVASALVDGLVAGSVFPGCFRACAAALLRTAPAPAARDLIDAMGEGYRTLIKRAEFETSEDVRARLNVLQQLYLERSREQQGDPARIDALFAELREALGRGQLGPLATQAGKTLIAAYDLEHDRWQDRAVDAAVIEQLGAAKDEATLRLFEARLQAQTLRQQVRLQIVRLHIAASTHPDDLARPDVVEARLMELGRNPVDLTTQAIEQAQLAQPMPWHSVYLHQDLRTQTAQLKGRLVDGSRWQSELPLRGLLQLKLQGLRSAITLCAPPEALDPEPCVLPSDVTTDTTLAAVDSGGVLHLADHLPLSEAIASLHSQDSLRVSLQVHGKPMLALDWKLHFQRPASLVMMGQRTGENGPAVDLTVECADPGLFLYTVQTAELRGSVALEQADLEQFFVVSQGAPGVDGRDGADGSRGRDAGECGNGQDGGDGKPGTDGGLGANGGDVHVRVRCSTGAVAPSEVAHLQAVLRKTVQSAAGSGGRAGRGGQGGLGGAGGTGRSSSCPSGRRGRDGVNGPDGRRGIPGAAGHVLFVE